MEDSFEPLRIIAGLRARGVSFVIAGDIAAMTQGADITPDRVEVCVDQDDEVIEHLTDLLTPLGGNKVDDGDDPARARYSTNAGILECVALEPAAFGRMRGTASAVPLGKGVLALIADPSELATERVASNDLVGAVRATALAERPVRLVEPVTIVEDEPEKPARAEKRSLTAVLEAARARWTEPEIDPEDEYGPDAADQPNGRMARFLRPFEKIDDFMNRLNDGDSRR